MKKWVSVEFGECPQCGDLAEIHTDSQKDEYFFDGDEARCQTCALSGQFCCDSEPPGHISWQY